MSEAIEIARSIHNSRKSINGSGLNVTAPVRNFDDAVAVVKSYAPDLSMTQRDNVAEALLIMSLRKGPTWKRVDSARYWDQLGQLPPAIQRSYGFLVGEAMTHVYDALMQRSVPAYTAFVERGDEFYECEQPMTARAFLDLDPSKIEVAA